MDLSSCKLSKNIDNLPANLFEVEHRTRDILFSDKTMHNIKMSKAFTVYLKLIDDLYNMLANNFKSQNGPVNLRIIDLFPEEMESYLL